MQLRNNVFLCFLAMLCEGIDIQSAGVAAAGIVGEMQPPPEALGYFFAASTVGLFLGAPFGGWLGDRKGRKFGLVLALVLFAVFSLLTAICTTIDQLTLTRFFTGLGLGGAMPNMIALTAESSAPERRSRNVTLMYSGVALGGALASVVAVISTPELWRAVFITGGVAPLLVALAIIFFVQEPQWRATGTGQSAPRPGVATTLMADGRALRTLLLWSSFFFALLLLYLLLNWLPLLLVGIGLSRPDAAFMMIIFNIGGAIGAAAIGFLLDKGNRMVTTALTFALLGVMLLLMAQAVSGVIAPLAFILGASVLAAQAIVYALAPKCYPRQVRGTGVGAAIGIGRLGSIAGPLFAGALLGAGQTSAQVLMGMLPIVGIAGVCAVFLASRLPVNVKDTD
jgi:MFS transporter, AAHS family, 3-hydroxyphenylpropionic acid transporter